MTGLNVDKDRIMEIACVITDSDLNVVAQQPEIIINQPSHILDQMNEWCTKQHGSVSCEQKNLFKQLKTCCLHKQCVYAFVFVCDCFTV